MERWHLTPKSGNKKTGPIAVTTAPAGTCPASCPMRDGLCYGGGADSARSGGPLGLHWDKVSRGERGTGWDEHVAALRALPADRMVRLHQVGDLPADPEQARALCVAASTGRDAPVWTYTHRTEDLEAVARLNRETRTVVNLSADNLEHADRLADQGTGPVCAIVPSEDKVQTTPGGRRVVRCPAEYGGVKDCASCGSGRPLCARGERGYVIGFYPHGSRKARLLRAVKGGS